MANDLASAILASSQRLGVDPVDLATAISYETAGTFDPWKRGPTTKWGEHRGLIQWGEPQRARYGVFEGMPVADQLKAAERYLTDAGVRPGMGLLDIYSAINAGGVGRYGASDAHAGGAPGTVADKVNDQMSGHRQKAEALLAGMFTPQAPSASAKAPKMQSGGTPAARPQGGVPAVFGDLVAPRPAANFGAVLAQFQKRRQEEQEAEEARRLALLGGLEGLYG